MPELEKRDHALWLRHLRAVGIHIPVGNAACLRINGREVQFEPMQPDRNGRLTHGLKASGPNAQHWHAIPKGTKLFVDCCVSAEKEVERLDRGEQPSSELLSRTPAVRRSNGGPPGVGTGRDALTFVSRSIGLPLPIEGRGSVAGLDVGYSESTASTGLCVLTWNESSVTWTCSNARSDDQDRQQKLLALAPVDKRVAAAAVDGPLVPGLKLHSRYRACEAILSCGVLQGRGKPGPTNGGSGPRLHQEARRLGGFALDQLEVGMANHVCSIHERAIVEAFPNLFLGTLCDENNYPERPSKKRKWTDTLFPLVSEKLGLLLRCLLPNREITGRWDLVDHEEIASFTCAVTALCAASGRYSGVGADDDGWIILPPREFLGCGWEGTLVECCQRCRRGFPGASIYW